MSKDFCPKGWIRNGFFTNHETCDVNKSVYDTTMWCYVVVTGLVTVSTTLIFIGLCGFFRKAVIYELLEKSKYTILMGAIWLWGTSGLVMTLLDRHDRFAGNDRTANVAVVVHAYASCMFCHFSGKNTRTIAGAIGEQVKGKMRIVGLVATSAFMLETCIFILSIVLDNGMIAVTIVCIRAGILEPLHVIVCGRLKLMVFEFIEGSNNEARKREYGRRKRRFQRLQFAALVFAGGIDTLICMILTEKLPAFYMAYPCSLYGLMFVSICPVLARRLFTINSKNAPKNYFLRAVVVPSNDRAESRGSEQITSIDTNVSGHEQDCEKAQDEPKALGDKNLVTATNQQEVNKRTPTTLETATLQSAQLQRSSYPDPDCEKAQGEVNALSDKNLVTATNQQEVNKRIPATCETATLQSTHLQRSTYPDIPCSSYPVDEVVVVSRETLVQESKDRGDKRTVIVTEQQLYTTSEVLAKRVDL